MHKSSESTVKAELTIQNHQNMRILIVSDAWYPQLNGVVRTYEHLKAALENKGHIVRVMGPADCAFTFPMPGYAEIRLALFPQKTLRKIIREFTPDIIHIAAEGPIGWAARRYCLNKDVPFTTSYHTHFPDYFAKRVANFLPFLRKQAKDLAIWYVRNFHSPSKTVLVATPSLENQLREWGFQGHMSYLSKGIDHNVFYIDSSKLFTELPRPIALYVGRVAVEKNIEDFLSMPWEGSKVVVGTGPSLDYLKNLYPKAVFVGKKEGKELADHYRSADVFVFPSKTDTFGIVIIEALACGIPVAGYNVQGPKDIITKPFLGAISDDSLSEAAYQALQMGKEYTPNTRTDYVKDEYCWSHAADQFIEAVKL